MSQVFRLGSELPAEFGTPVVKRDRPIRFGLNGRTYSALEGDTVLSALLANGIDSVGQLAGSAIALDPASAPPVVLAGTQAEMPMPLCPVVDGISLRTTLARKPSTPIKSLFTGGGNSLGLDLDAPRIPGNWIDAEPDETFDVDIVVVGGGIAGMSAALAAADDGAQVALIEREPVLGGMAAFFGKSEGETPPEDIVSELADAVSRHAAIRVLTLAEAFELNSGRVRVVQVLADARGPRPVHQVINCKNAILATGVEERLPIFPGNRLPKVIGATFAWKLARQYNVWPGTDFHLHTATNAGYRLAILGSEAGRRVEQASDPRSDPRTRFIEFCKAYGFRFGWGKQIKWARPDRNGLALGLVSEEFGGTDDQATRSSALIVSGGWQPAIALWLHAGGAVTWDGNRNQLRPDGRLTSVVLAGSVTGISGSRACIESGRASVDELRDGQRRAIADPQIAEIYESRDGPLTVSVPSARGMPPAWRAQSCTAALPEPPRRGIAAFITRQPADRPVEIGTADILDIAGSVATGDLSASEVPGYSRQWCIVPRIFRAGELPEPAWPVEDDIPAYLTARFGLSQSCWTLEPDSERDFDPGCLIFINTDDTHPSSAIGVIVSGEGAHCVAVMARTEFGGGDIVYVRDGAMSIGARLDRKL